MKQITSKELLWFFIASTLILLWGSIPTWAGYQAETDDLRFRGIYFDSQDYAVHISMMEAGRQGETYYQFRFTTEPHTPAYLRLFYVGLGHISRLINLPTETTFQLARWVLGYIALFALYQLLSRIFPDVFWARTAFLLASLGSGLGWLQLIFNWAPGPITPIDFWLIDCYVFFSLSLFPHFAFVTAGMCILLSLWLDHLDTPRWQAILWMSVVSVLVQFVNPIALATVDAGLVGATLASWWKERRIRWTDVLALGVVALAQLPLLAYNFIVLNNGPVWSQFTAQNKTLSPPLDYYLWGFALFLPFALIGIVELFHSKSRASAASLFWVVSGITLAYVPVFIQRRFLQNITIPLAILATYGLIRLFETVPAQSPLVKRWKSSLVILFVFIASISSIQLSLGRMSYLQTHPTDLYYPTSLDDSVTWLRDNAQYNDFVLAAEETSQVLAQKTGMRVYFGHQMETLNYDGKQDMVKSFFNGNMDGLASAPVKWVIYGFYEQAINPDFQPANNLELVFESQELMIYKVKE
jgi:hypothetical protein